MKRENEKSQTFVVRITSAPGKKWQGTVASVANRMPQPFESMQDMLRLMDQSLVKPEQDR